MCARSKVFEMFDPTKTLRRKPSLCQVVDAFERTHVHSLNSGSGPFVLKTLDMSAFQAQVRQIRFFSIRAVTTHFRKRSNE